MHAVSSAFIAWRKNWRTDTSTRAVLHVSIALVGVVIARLLGSVTQIVLARWMGVADFGVYTTMYTLLGPVIMIASLGLDTWLLRQGHDATTLDSAISQVFAMRLLAIGGLMLLAVSLIFASGRVTLTIPIVFAALGLTCELLLTTAHTALRAQIRNGAASVLQMIVAGLTLILIWVFWTDRAPLLAATGYRLLADAIGVVLLIWLLRRSLRFMVWRVAPLVRMIKQAWPYFASDLLAMVAMRADLMLVALIIGAIGAGIYAPALTIINMTFLMPTVAWQVLLPILSRQPVGARSFRTIMILTAVGHIVYGIGWAIVLWWNSELLIRVLFQASYLDAATLLQIMSLIPLIKSINFCTTLIMVARDQQIFRTKLQSIGAIFNVTANVIGIPLFGLVGAACVNLATEVVLLACYGYGAWRTSYRLA